MFTPWKESYDQPRQHIKKQRYYFVHKALSSQGYGFPSSHVWMWELDYKESWELKNGCFWTVVLEKTLESHLLNKNKSQIYSIALGEQVFFLKYRIISVQFSSVAQSCLTLCDPMNCSTPGLPVHHQLLEFTKTHVHRVGDAINHLILCCSFLLPSIFPSIRVFSNESALHEVAKILEFQLQLQSFQWTPGTDLL